MITSTIEQAPKKPAMPLFPCLRIDSDGDVFLFTKETNRNHCSPLVFSTLNPGSAGVKYTSADLECDSVRQEYKPFHGSITLTSE